MAFGVALLLALAAQPQRYPPVPPVSPSIRLSELRDLPDWELARRLFGPLDPFPVVGYRSPLGFSPRYGRATLSFWTRPRAGEREGVCQTQRMTVRFEREPIDLGDPRDPALRPALFDLQTYFIVADRKKAFARFSTGEKDGFLFDAECAKREPWRDSIPADNAYQLVQGLELAEALGEGARKGRAPAPLDCSGFHLNGAPPADEAACLKELSDLAESSVAWVRQCRPRREAPGGCIQVQSYGRFIDFDLDSAGKLIRIVAEALQDTSSVE